ncbi:MAG: hypothetical protein IGR93_09765 [Hydrococcus sp. C42_A2020_068]|nr:hypothetical protein [Pleurocapsa sp. PCC 7327]AFY75854.1 hypothetical protein Ple7327_0394 [Pleurocapsa sp. PCC 7327]MBF2020370.1 hypothetical protein [Hydrococcus sp. C42_A2020_068]
MQDLSSRQREQLLELAVDFQQTIAVRAIVQSNPNHKRLKTHKFLKIFR